jgi:hypothetical protein
MRNNRRRLLALGSALLAIAAVVFIYDTYRNEVMARLYAEALGHSPYYRGSVESQAAVKPSPPTAVGAAQLCCLTSHRGKTL